MLGLMSGKYIYEVRLIDPETKFPGKILWVDGDFIVPSLRRDFYLQRSPSEWNGP